VALLHRKGSAPLQCVTGAISAAEGRAAARARARGESRRVTSRDAWVDKKLRVTGPLASWRSTRHRPPTGGLDRHRWWRLETEIRSDGPAIGRAENKHFSIGRTATFL